MKIGNIDFVAWDMLERKWVVGKYLKEKNKEWRVKNANW